MGNKMRGFACFIFAIGLGSTLGDIDHILPPFQRSWGHNIWILLVVSIVILVVTYLSRQIRTWFLRKGG